MKRVDFKFLLSGCPFDIIDPHNSSYNYFIIKNGLPIVQNSLIYKIGTVWPHYSEHWKYKTTFFVSDINYKRYSGKIIKIL